MPAPSDFQPRRGTVIVTFTQTGTYSSWADMGGMELVGVMSRDWPGGAGSLTFRGAWDTLAYGGTGMPITTEAGAAYRVNPYAVGTFYSFTPGSVIVAPQFIMAQVGTAGTAGNAAGGTLILIGRA